MNNFTGPDASGFTLVELLVAFAIVGILLAVSVPLGMNFYDGMQYRQAVRTVTTTLSHARAEALQTGRAQDVTLNPESKTLTSGKGEQSLPASINMVVQAAADLSGSEGGVIRFYPEGGSTGGDVDLENRSGSGVRISVDWLTGGLSQEAFQFD